MIGDIKDIGSALLSVVVGNIIDKPALSSAKKKLYEMSSNAKYSRDAASMLALQQSLESSYTLLMSAQPVDNVKLATLNAQIAAHILNVNNSYASFKAEKPVAAQPVTVLNLSKDYYGLPVWAWFVVGGFGLMMLSAKGSK